MYREFNLNLIENFNIIFVMIRDKVKYKIAKYLSFNVILFYPIIKNISSWNCIQNMKK